MGSGQPDCRLCDPGSVVLVLVLGGGRGMGSMLDEASFDWESGRPLEQRQDLECRVIPGKLGKVAVCSGNQEEPGWTNCAIPRGPGEARGGREAGKVTGQVSEGARHREVGGRTFCVSCEAVFKMFYIMLPIIP